MKPRSYIHPKVKVYRIGNQKGLRATALIKKGEILTVSAGIGMSYETVRSLPKERRKYCFYVENNFFYCPYGKSLTPDWFMNHSCNANAGG